MADNQIKSLDDIVFEHKNKSYGAYNLRKTEKSYLFKAFLIGTIIFVLFVLLLFFYNRWQAKKAAQEKEVNVTLTDINIPEEKEEIVEIKEEKAPPPVQQDNVASVKMIMPEPKKNVIREETVPPKEAFDKGNPGTKDKEGDKGDAGNPGEQKPGEQKPPPIDPPPPSNKVFDVVDQEAVFKGKVGITAFIGNNLEYTEKAIDNGTEGKIIVKFVVERDGSVSDVKVISKRLGDGLDEEAIRAIKKTSGMWTPGKVNDQPVRSYFRVPITFRAPQ